MIAHLTARLDAINENATELRYEAYGVIMRVLPEHDHAGYEGVIRDLVETIQKASDKLWLEVREIEAAAERNRPQTSAEDGLFTIRADRGEW